MRSLRRSSIPVAIALAAGAAGCASVGDPGVAVRPLSVDVVFGVPPEEPVAAPPSVPSAPLAPMSGYAFKPTKPTLAPTVDLTACKEAPITAAAKLEAPLELTKERPRMGAYRWKRTGTITSGETTTTLDGFEQREIFNLQEREQVNPTSHAPAFGYSTLQPSVDDPSVLVRIDWNYDGSTAPLVSPPAAVQGAAEDARPFRTGNDGLGIERITRYQVQDDGSLVQIGMPFAPTRPVTFISHPITLNETYRSVGTDPESLATMVMQEKPVDKTQVDACGDKVDAYVVEATMTFTEGATTTTSSLRYGVATQYGAIIVFEDAETETASGTIKTSFSLGQLNPSQLPKREFPS